ncbi:MAG: hypothetical protein IKB38_09215 [Clostridia bacterium]|nr:hypothetical protein [Clostridia bacterium]
MRFTRFIALFLALLCIGATLVFVASCGEFNSAEWYEDNESTRRAATYKSFSDEKNYEIDVDGKISMNIKVETISGDAFYARIYNVKTQNNPVYTLAIHKNESGVLVADVNYAGEKKQIPLNSNTLYEETVAIMGEDDEFIINVVGQNHTGSFKFDW